MFSVWLWSVLVYVYVLPVPEITNASLSVWLRCLRKIFIISPPFPLAFALIDWQTRAGTEPEIWLKWRNKKKRWREEKATEPAHQVHKRQGLTPSLWRYKSLCHSHSSCLSSALSRLYFSCFDLTPSMSASRDSIWQGFFRATVLISSCSM